MSRGPGLFTLIIMSVVGSLDFRLYMIGLVLLDTCCMWISWSLIRT